MRIIKPIIVISTGRAGSTLFSEILFRHRLLGFLSNYNEKFPDYPYVSILRHLFDNKFYRSIGIKKQQHNQPGALNRFLFTPSEAWSFWQNLMAPQIDFSRNFLLGYKANQELIDKTHQYLGRVLFWQGRDRLAFKITGPSRLEFLLSIFPDAKIIRIKRDPLATVYSFLNVDFWKIQGIQQLWWKGAYSSAELEIVEKNKNNPVWMTAFQVKKILDITDREIKQFNPNLTEVIYETFIEDPLFFTKEIFNSLGLGDDSYAYKYFKEFPIKKSKTFDINVFSKEDIKLLSKFFNDSACIG
jgi:omega-hydroxy-beta-dihydromenaquinone-9 sulfotransferase